MKVTIPKAVVVTAFNTALASTKVSANTLGKRQGKTSWYKNSSHILLPTGVKVPIPIPEYTTKITSTRKLRHYVHDMESTAIQATVAGKRVQVDIRFESGGEEIKTKCVRRRLRKWDECTLEMKRDIHLNNTFLSVSVVPVAYKGSISYADPKVRFKTDVKIASQLCQAFKGICGMIEQMIKTKMTAKLESKVRTTFNRADMKQHVANAVKNAPGVRGYLQGRKVLKVESKGNNFIVTLKDP
jgi:hypothetical protein